MSRQPTRGWRAIRGRIAVVAALALVSGALAAGPPALAAPDGSGGADKKIDAELAADFGKDSTQDFFVRFADKADLTAASKVKGWGPRGDAVWKALVKNAERSQEGVIADLERRGVDYKSYPINNSLLVRSGTSSLASTLASDPQVSEIEAPATVQLEKPLDAKPEHKVNAVEWGIADIRADETWADFGVDGNGIVVASIDSGVEYTHPALVGKYRGNLGNGNFDHNDNWFDPSEVCGDPEPCDNNDHGTHTMGTMVGSDGDNQIGVAPGARWMSAKGCETNSCSEFALTEAATWMLHPTDLNGENPDASKRPNIINNSWGGGPDDDWYESFVDAWVAAGMFPSWSNGNSGPGCDTAGAPGEYVQSYAAGNHTINRTIASSSSRGPGVGDDVKPNISAPGTAVRSSIPGDGYAAFTGTSMAAPHVSGSVALLWEAAPSLVGDIDGTRALLDGSAIDSENLTCGGTAEDNNVFGEGFLDVYSAVEAAPRGDSGVLRGTVSDASDDSAIDGADVEVTGTSARSTTTDNSGGYRLNLLAGTYDVSVSAFGYLPEEVTGVEVPAEAETVQDVELEPAPSATLSGTVTDGSGHGWPLYAEVTVAGTPVSTYTDPETGEYSLSLPSGSSYDVTVTPVYAGYVAATETVDLTGGNASQDFSVLVDTNACKALGYTVDYDGLLENFDGTDTPEGWTVVDNIGNGQVWRFDDPGGLGNLTGGEGGFAVVDSDNYGNGNTQDTELVSPVFDLTGVDTPVLEFDTDYNDLGNEQADVDLSLDGGETWTNVWTQLTDLRGPTTVRIPLPDAANETDVQLRFHYYVGSWDWWWQVDEVFVGNRRCVPVEGGLVLGNVSDLSAGEPLNGATVTSEDVPADKGTAGPTPDDDAIADGFYWLFSSVTGDHPFTAAKSGFESKTKTVTVAGDDVTRADFALGAGHLVVTPTNISTLVTLGGSQEKTFKISNDGTGAANVEIGERDGGFQILRADGTKTTAKEVATGRGAPLQRIKADVTPLQKTTAKGSATGRADLAQTPHDEPWVDITDYPSNIMDNSVASYDGKVYSFGGTVAGLGATDAAYVYDPAELTWSSIAPMPEGRQKPAGAFVGGKYYAVGGWGGGSGQTVAETAIYDPATDSWSTGADNPSPWAAAGTAVLDGQIYAVGGCGSACGETDVVRYDPASDSYDVLADYPEPTSWLACGAVDRKVVCAGGNGGSAGSDSAFAYDPGTDSWDAIADMPVDVWAASYANANDQLLISGGVAGGAITNAGWAYGPDGEWTELPNSNNALYRGGAACGMYEVGGSVSNFNSTPLAEMLPGYDNCGGGGDVSWLSADPTTLTVAPGETVEVTVTTDAAQVAQPGTYTAQLTIAEDTPYPSTTVDVTMQVAPPKSWGKLTGTVTGTSCDGANGPLAGAIVRVNGKAESWNLFTDSSGGYARWMKAENKLQMIAARDGYVPEVTQAAVKKGKTTTVDFDLMSSKC